jgi:DNA-binding phage protein
MPRKAPITLKREITALLASDNFGSRALILDDKDVLLLLRAAIEQEGSISAFAKRHGLERTYLTSALNGKRPVSVPLVKALGLRKVYAPHQDNE